MDFTVRDLMLNVLPETNDAVHELRLCEPITTAPEPKPPPKPKPKPKPKPGQQQPACLPITILGVDATAEASVELPPLAVLREQLHQALHP